MAVASPAAHADEASRLARGDYDAGAAAYERKDYANAAKSFARADERVPNSRALQLAMAAALASSDPPRAGAGKGSASKDAAGTSGADAALAMDLVERAETRAVDGSLVELAQRLRKRFGSAAGRIRLVCPPHLACRGRVDDRDRELEDGRTAWATTGKHIVHVRAETADAASAKDQAPGIDREILVSAGAVTDVTPLAPELTSKPAVNPPNVHAPVSQDTQAAPEILPERHSKGIAPVYFWTTLGVTVAAAGAATVFTVMIKSKHDDFVANPTQQTADDGQSAQTRARIVWGVTGALAVTTIAVGALTDFSGSNSGSKSAARAVSPADAHRPVSVAIGPGSVLLVGSFR